MQGLLLSSTIDLEALRRILRVVTTVYLAVPILLFSAGWVRAPGAVLLVAALAAVVANLARRQRGRPRPHIDGPARISVGSLALALAPVAVAVLLSGAGGWGPRTWDWAKHDAILRDLVVQPWPVRYSTEAGSTALVYYVGYYLPAAAVGKLAGWAAANGAVVLTSLVGAALAVLWLVVLTGASPPVCAALFVVFSGMDILGAAALSPPGSGVTRLFSEFFVQDWARTWQYSGSFSLLCFVPNQAIGGWLLTALAADRLEPARPAPPVVALAALGLLWSPFVTIGLLPLVLASVLVSGRPVRSAVREQLSAANLAGAALAVPLLSYFGARMRPLALPSRYHPAATPAARADFWFVPAHMPLETFFARYLLFVSCEFAALWVLLLWAQSRDPRAATLRPLLVVSGFTLLVLPFFHYGLYNDLVMRASIPALFVVQICAAHALRGGVRSPAALAVAAVLAVGALAGGNLLRLQARPVVWSRRLVRLPSMGSVRNLFQIQLHDPPAMKKEFVAQYLGATDSLFFRLLARDSAPVDVTGPDPPGSGVP
ncbi:MAG TPA: hypothetical protein VMT19_08255 [Thermoanaerobaculaceae bacterium]|nr:hypothetical protein [Thermoanaerobaculaceae bacterium]